jgi:hypothetical protein
MGKKGTSIIISVRYFPVWSFLRFYVPHVSHTWNGGFIRPSRCDGKYVRYFPEFIDCSNFSSLFFFLRYPKTTAHHQLRGLIGHVP